MSLQFSNHSTKQILGLDKKSLWKEQEMKEVMGKVMERDEEERYRTSKGVGGKVQLTPVFCLLVWSRAVLIMMMVLLCSSRLAEEARIDVMLWNLTAKLQRFQWTVLQSSCYAWLMLWVFQLFLKQGQITQIVPYVLFIVGKIFCRKSIESYPPNYK